MDRGEHEMTECACNIGIHGRALTCSHALLLAVSTPLFNIQLILLCRNRATANCFEYVLNTF